MINRRCWLHALFISLMIGLVVTMNTNAVRCGEQVSKLESNITLDSMNLANHRISIEFEWFNIESSQPFVAVLYIPEYDCISKASLVESSTNRVTFHNKTTLYRNSLVKSDKIAGFLNMWPFDSYNIDILLGSTETLHLEEDCATMDIGLGSNLLEMGTWDLSWSVKTLVDVPSPLSLQTSELNLTCFYDFRISISRGFEYSVKNTIYFIPLFLIIVLLACCQIFYIPAKGKYLADHLRVFLAFIALLVSSLFSIGRLAPPQVTFVETAFLAAGLSYAILLVYIVSRISHST